MSEHKDEQWLDNQLQRAIDGSTPRFDAEAWKQKHRDEYQTLVARSKHSVRWGKPHPTVWVVRLAVAATIAVAVGWFVIGRTGPTEPRGPVADSSPTKMMSMMSLRTAYQRGGFEQLDRQLQVTLDEFGPRSSSVSVRELSNM